MTFEYHSEHSLARLGVGALNKLGSEGWELVSVTFAQHQGWVYCFKRPARQASDAT